MKRNNSVNFIQSSNQFLVNKPRQSIATERYNEPGNGRRYSLPKRVVTPQKNNLFVTKEAFI